MPRYFARLAYKGTAYCGWQKQINAPSVQQAVEEALTTLLHSPTPVTGAGRTDTGVHALFYVIHFDAAPIDAAADLVYHLNCLLPRDISFSSIYEVPDSAHARFDARYREYKYFINTHKDPFNQQLSWYVPVPLDVDAMQRATAKLLGFEDFTSLARLHSDNKTNLCTIFNAGWEISAENLIFTVGANRFLRGMVRAMVGTIVDVGKGKLTVDRFEEILERKDRAAASASAPPEGLFLSDIKYDFDAGTNREADTQHEHI